MASPAVRVVPRRRLGARKGEISIFAREVAAREKVSGQLARLDMARARALWTNEGKEILMTSRTPPVLPEQISRLYRWFFAVCIVGGTAATLVSVATNPGYYRQHTDAASFVTAFAAASPIMSETHVLAMIVVSYLLPVGLLAMAWLALRRAPWWASSAALLLLLGVFPTAIFAGQDALSYDIARLGSNPLLLTLARQFDRDEVMSYFNAVFDLGSILGPTLLGVALWRARVLPTWAAVLITFSRPLVFLYPALPPHWQLGYLVQIPSSLALFLGSVPAARALLKELPGTGAQTRDDQAVGTSLKP